MALSSELISQLVKATKPVEKKPTEATVYGTTVDQNGDLYVQIDGSDVLTPVASTVKMKSGERVIVTIKDHTAVVTGNLTIQSARSDDVDDLVDEITAVEILVADKVSTEEFDAVNGRIDNLVSDNVLIRGSLTAVEATISDLEADNVVINDKLTATDAAIENLETTKLSVDIADLRYASIGDLDAVNAVIYNLDATYATITDLDAVRADIDRLDAEKISTDDLNAQYANIDFANIGEAAIETFFSKSGIIEDLVLSDGKVTGTLVGVTIIGDLIKGGTVQADKLVIKGEDGLYYKLNIEGGATTSETVTEEDLQNGLSGSIIVAKSITAEKVAVDDLVAFGATIGGFHITEDSLYSGAKASVDNTTRGIYQNTDGQFAVGDADNYLKFYKDTDGTYKLAISAASMTFSTTGKNIEDTMQDKVDEIEVGGRNLAIGSANNYSPSGFNNPSETVTGESGYIITDETYNSCKIATWNGSATSKFSGPFFGVDGCFGTTLEIGETYTLSAWMKADVATKLQADNLAEEQTPISNSLTVETVWTRIWRIFTATSEACNFCFYTDPNATSETPNIYMCGIKLEKGNKATDWTPAPEDMATSEEVENAQTSADEANTAVGSTTERVSVAESTIQQLADSIAMLITDENGASLMTQTENGWTFNMSHVTGTLDSAMGDIESLTEELGGMDSTVSALEQAISDLGILTDYVIITTYDDQPCIELGEAENGFKLRITNTQIQFLADGAIPAWLSNQKLYIERAEITRELQFGGFVLTVRSNGNAGIMWKGVDS